MAETAVRILSVSSAAIENSEEADQAQQMQLQLRESEQRILVRQVLHSGGVHWCGTADAGGDAAC